ncbi:hypothetical protein ACFSUE_01255 [Sporolactobacillus shoreicorticis]|uniref:Uncharacterized protein n=1 Tax=Sporolactobacillus shoreicorticis TaxID=1923877 RepID=A0ABW5RYU0_9BACL
MSDQILDGSARNDESNKFLREQNSKILTMLGDIEQKKQEAHIWTLKVHAYHFARLTSTADAKRRQNGLQHA